ncbi:hypothetical protein THMIRHAT_09780 [Thiosulfativibrio zosterae]|uniref:Uncharacterized protein n=1 Tax=Thiosulfativibrio zosterae TaxID=2675053 RepID=A0A6F8PMA3_9GAMM|nr:hypothetical protein THMIRHAT_09780 [Thiosulfativibrio zosterae]
MPVSEPENRADKIMSRNKIPKRKGKGKVLKSVSLHSQSKNYYNQLSKKHAKTFQVYDLWFYAFINIRINCVPK